MDSLIEQFIDIRNYLSSSLIELTQIYFTGLWDPYMRFIIIKETNALVDRVMAHDFPDFPKEYFPKIKFRILDEIQEINVEIQTYINTRSALTFLGTCDVEGSPFDFYIRRSFDPDMDYTFYARYGHTQESIHTGERAAATEYFQGAVTPLSIAFGMAVEDGFIS